MCFLVSFVRVEMPPGIRTDIALETPVLTISFIHAEEAEGEEVEIGEVSDEPEVITEAKTDEAMPETKG